VQAAQARADQIIAQSRVECDVTKREADEYVMDTLSKLELELDRFLGQVRNGIRSLQEDRSVEPIEHT
jgi:hypothetical protein